MSYANATVLTTINQHFKYIQDKAQSLLPENAILMKLIPEISEATKEGRKYLVPVQLSHENGVTFGDGTVFALNDAASAIYEEIEVDASPIILLTQISESVANRMANSKQTFITEASLRAQVMYDSLARVLEISMLYGQCASGVGTFTLGTWATYTTYGTVVLTAASWAPGIWAGAVGAYLNVYYGSTLVSSSTNADFLVTNVAMSTRTITISGSTTGIAAIETNKAQALYFVLKGSYTNAMLGLDAQIVGGTTFFGIDPTVYPLWQGQTYACGSASLTMSKVLAGAGLCVSAGGLNSDAVLMVSAATYANLNADQAALRMYDSSYSAKENDNGSEGLVYMGPNGRIKVTINNIVKEGEAFLLPTRYLKRVGAKELSFERPGQKDQFFQEIPGYAGYSLRAGAEFAVLLERPAQACKFTAIVNS